MFFSTLAKSLLPLRYGRGGGFVRWASVPSKSNALLTLHTLPPPPPPAMISDLGWGQRMDTASVGLPGVGEVGAEEEGQVKEGGKGKEEWRCWVERW